MPKAIAAPMPIFSVERLNTPTGPILIVTDNEHCVRAVDWGDHEQRLQILLRRHYGDNSIRLRETKCPSVVRLALQAYFEGDMGALTDIRVLTNGTDFQRKVWDALRCIPVGHTISYGALAVRIGRPKAMRAVGLANGANPIPIIVPCHRVIGANGSLTGFGGGLDRKRWLLTHEARASHAVNREPAACAIDRQTLAAHMLGYPDQRAPSDSQDFLSVMTSDEQVTACAAVTVQLDLILKAT
jgi:methylated-DNA-[protein]-cysteine S-methyltransferase